MVGVLVGDFVGDRVGNPVGKGVGGAGAMVANRVGLVTILLKVEVISSESPQGGTNFRDLPFVGALVGDKHLVVNSSQEPPSSLLPWRHTPSQLPSLSSLSHPVLLTLRKATVSLSKYIAAPSSSILLAANVLCPILILPDDCPANKAPRSAVFSTKVHPIILACAH